MEVCWKLGATTADGKTGNGHAALQQSRLYGATIQAMGRQVAWADIRKAGRSVGTAQAILRPALHPALRLATFGLISRGPLWHASLSADEKALALRKLRRDLPGRGARILLVTPEEPESSILPLYTAATLAELPLGPKTEMRAAMDGKWRNRLVRAEGSKLNVVATRNPDHLLGLLEKEVAQQRSKRYRALPPRFVANWIRADPKAFRLYRAMIGAECIAEMLFLDHAPAVTYQVGWTAGAGRSFSAHHFLLWRAMCDFSKAGRRVMDLGSLDTVTAPGLARFKLGSGAQARRLGPTGLVLPRPNLIGMVRSAALTSPQNWRA